MVGCDTRTASVTVVGLGEAVPFREVYICAVFAIDLPNRFIIFHYMDESCLDLLREQWFEDD